MRDEDLIPAFLGVAEDLRLNKYDRAKVRKLRAEWDGCVMTSIDEGPCKVHEDDPCVDQLSETTAELFELLENYAPPFAHFGAHEGDGADYGFWISHESLDEAVEEGEILRESSNGMRSTYTCGTRTDDMPGMFYGMKYRYRLVISDHGNMTLYYRNGREVWGVV